MKLNIYNDRTEVIQIDSDKERNKFESFLIPLQNNSMVLPKMVKHLGVIFYEDQTYRSHLRMSALPLTILLHGF